MSSLFADAVLVHAYTRAQAIEDGVLVDVSEVAREAGFKVPVALTAAVWADCVAWDNAREVCHQDESGRLWDVLAMASFEARAHRHAQSLGFSLLRVRSGGLRPERVRLVLHIGPGDQGEPVITILQPGED